VRCLVALAARRRTTASSAGTVGYNDRDTSSGEAHTAALIAIEGRLNLIAQCLRAIADSSGADMSTVSILGTEEDIEEAH
jgi:hypothetical protein